MKLSIIVAVSDGNLPITFAMDIGGHGKDGRVGPDQ